MLPVVGAGQAVLAVLPASIVHQHANAHVLTWQRGADRTVIDPLGLERYDVLGLGDLLRDLPVPPHDLRADATGAVEATLGVGERERHQPVHLAPGGSHLWGDRIPEDVADGPHE